MNKEEGKLYEHERVIAYHHEFLPNASIIQIHWGASEDVKKIKARAPTIIETNCRNYLCFLHSSSTSVERTDLLMA